MTLGITTKENAALGYLIIGLKYNYTVLYFKHEFLNTLQLLLLSFIQVKMKHCSAGVKIDATNFFLKIFKIDVVV